MSINERGEWISNQCSKKRHIQCPHEFDDGGGRRAYCDCDCHREEKIIANFDSDLSPESHTNQKAAKDRGLRFDAAKEHYVDEDGCLIRDKFGQPL